MALFNFLDHFPEARPIHGYTGNTVIDALKTTVRDDYRFATDELNHLPYGERKVLLVTCHRRENYGEPMKKIQPSAASFFVSGIACAKPPALL